jgi:ethanolamine utilization protein EutN
MLVARVEGHATATVKHPSLTGAKLVVVQPLRSLTTDPLLVIDTLGAGRGHHVLISSDGKGARELVGDATSPARWSVVGILEHMPGWDAGSNGSWRGDQDAVGERNP